MGWIVLAIIGWFIYKVIQAGPVVSTAFIDLAVVFGTVGIFALVPLYVVYKIVCWAFRD